NLHGDERLARLGATWAGAPGWHDDPDLSAAKVIVANAATPLAALLEFDTRFQCVHAAGLAKVFVARPRRLTRQPTQPVAQTVPHATLPSPRKSPPVRRPARVVRCRLRPRPP